MRWHDRPRPELPVVHPGSFAGSNLWNKWIFLLWGAFCLIGILAWYSMDTSCLTLLLGSFHESNRPCQPHAILYPSAQIPGCTRIDTMIFCYNYHYYLCRHCRHKPRELQERKTLCRYACKRLYEVAVGTTPKPRRRRPVDNWYGYEYRDLMLPRDCFARKLALMLQYCLPNFAPMSWSIRVSVARCSPQWKPRKRRIQDPGDRV